jgi:hypothetical protein
MGTSGRNTSVETSLSREASPTACVVICAAAIAKKLTACASAMATKLAASV